MSKKKSAPDLPALGPRLQGRIEDFRIDRDADQNDVHSLVVKIEEGKRNQLVVLLTNPDVTIPRGKQSIEGQGIVRTSLAPHTHEKNAPRYAAVEDHIIEECRTGYMAVVAEGVVSLIKGPVVIKGRKYETLKGDAVTINLESGHVMPVISPDAFRRFQRRTDRKVILDGERLVLLRDEEAE
ncbi:hypothetical protein HYZ98_04700 [Candidatus Peregrinibacteria bacterium]|nr:hypothetical protein [Candidatus Peregrinibacteria bacterium]